MTVLPQLERDLVEAHARVTMRRGRLWHRLLSRPAGAAGGDAVGSVTRGRRVALAGARGLPMILVVAVTLGVGAAFFVLGHARHASTGTASARLAREQRYVAIAGLQTQRRDPACVAAPPWCGSHRWNRRHGACCRAWRRCAPAVAARSARWPTTCSMWDRPYRPMFTRSMSDWHGRWCCPRPVRRQRRLSGSTWSRPPM